MAATRSRMRTEEQKVGVHIREPLIRAERETSRRPGSGISGDFGWTGSEERDEKYREKIGLREKKN